MTAWASTGLKGLDKILCDLKKGDNVALVGFGAGLTYGGIVVKWAI